MKLLNKYILKQIFVGFVLVLASMTVLVWLTQSLKMIDMIVTNGVPVRIFLKMTLLVLPNFLQVLSPLALFAVVLFVFSRMQSDKELMVMQAIGMSPKQIMKPALMFAFALTILGYVLTLVLVPEATTSLREMKWQVKNDLSHLLLQEGQFNSFKNGLTLYVKERLPDGSVKGVMAYETKDPEKTSVLIAKGGVVLQEEKGVRVIFQEGVRQELNPKTKQFSVLKFDQYTMWFNDKKNEGETRSSDVGEYDLKTLILSQPKDAENEVVYRKMKVEALKRILQPLYNFTFAFLAMFGVLSAHYNRRGQMGRINLVVVLALIIQSLALAFENISGKNLVFLPLMAVNVFLPIIVLYLIMIRGYSVKIKGVRIEMILIVLITSLIASTAIAQVKADFEHAVDKDKPVDFESDTVFYDKKNDTVIASGDVVAIQEKTILKADKLIYNRQKNQMTAQGNVVLTIPDGTTTKTQELTLSGDMKEAVSGAMIMKLVDGTHITASRLKRTHAGTVLYLKDVTYTPCDFCEGTAPLWSLRSNDVKHDAVDKTMTYKNSFLEVKDIPIFYFPYLQTPDFTVKRKTGFLSPSLSHGEEMKGGITTPFFVDLSDNQNLLLTPTFSPTHDPLIIADYKGLYKEGFLNVQASGTRDNDDDKKQGHIKADFRYDVSDLWRIQGQYFRTSSDTYFRRYSIPGIDDSRSFLRSYIAAERFGTQNYFAVQGLSFQSLQDRVSSDSIPIIIPMMFYRVNTDPLTDNGLYAFTEVDSAIYQNRQRFKSNRLSVTQGLHLPYVSTWGAAFDIIGTVRADGYQIDTGEYAFGEQKTDDTYTTGRIYPVGSVKMSYPMAMSTENTSQVLEPIVMLVSAPNSGNNDKIPDVDSIDFDFDDTNLFSRNRFAGYDRVETGTRVNYGLQWSLYDTNDRSISTMFGQSYRLTDDDEMNALMGNADSNASDYVGRVQVNYHAISLAYRFRLDERNMQPKKNEITLSGGSDPLRLGIDYVYLKPVQIADNYYSSREELLFFGSSKFSKNWSVSGYYRYDLAKDGGPVEAGLITQYDNECIAIAFDLERSFTSDRDYSGGTSMTVKFILKSLGGM